MMDPSFSESEPLPADVARQIDQACNRFEQAWRGGQRPSVEDVLGGVDPLYRGPATWELVLLDIFYRRRAGERPAVEDYQHSFPELDAARLAGALTAPSLEVVARADSLTPGEETTDGNHDDANPRRERSRVRYFGDYELLEEIARGGMGVVYRAQQKSLNRQVALKMILAGRLAGDDEVKRFYREAQHAAGLDHPGIVPIFEVGKHEEHHFYSMGLVEGRNLAAEADAAPMSPRRAAELVRAAAAAVHYAHGKGVIHRDLKPANILVDATGNPRITDFGLARNAGQASDLTAPGQVIGTPAYMSPEQAEGDASRVGVASDVYCLGAILYFLLTGRPPFQGHKPVDVLLQLRHDEPVPPRKLRPQVARDLENICLKCLHKKPARRYSSAQDLADDLGRFLNGETIAARPAGRLERTLRWVKRHRSILIVAALAGVIAVFAWAGFGWLRHARARQEVTQQTEAFLNALRTNDAALMPGVLTEKAQKSFSKESLWRFRRWRLKSHEIQSVNLAEDAALVYVLAKDDAGSEEIELRFRRENGAWRLHWLDDGRPFDFEVPPFPVDYDAPPLPEPMDVAQFTAQWKIDLDINDEPAGQALSRLASEMRLSLIHRGEQQELLASRVTLRKTGCSRFEAIEEICGKLNLYPRYEAKKIALQPGPRSLPVSFAGPFFIEVDRVKQFPPHGTGVALIVVRTYGFSPRLTDRWQRRFDIEKISEPGGAELLDESVGYSDGWAHEAGLFQFRQTVPLKNLLRDVKSVRLAGQTSVRVPGGSQKFHFKHLRAGMTESNDHASVKLLAITPKSPFIIDLVMRGARREDTTFVPLDAAGQPLPINATTSFDNPEFATVRLTVHEKPAALDVTCLAHVQDVEFPFQLDIPMPRHAEMPEVLAKASFPGQKTPLAVTAAEIIERGDPLRGGTSKIRMHLTNHADKPVRRLTLRHHYLDDKGINVGNFLSSYTPSSGEPPITVGAGGKAEITQIAFPPEEATRVTVTVEAVEFADASWWRLN